MGIKAPDNKTRQHFVGKVARHHASVAEMMTYNTYTNFKYKTRFGGGKARKSTKEKMERPTKRQRSVTEEELDGSDDREKGKNCVNIIEESDCEFMDCEKEDGPSESIEDLMKQLKHAILKDDSVLVEKILQSMDKLDNYVSFLNHQDVRKPPYRIVLRFDDEY